MNMIRKLILTISFIIMFASSAFAYGTPRWFNIPISVYVPKTTESAAVMSAFREWQTVSGGSVRFLFRNSGNLANLSDISVNIVSNTKNTEGYDVKFIYSPATYNTTYFYKARITVATSDSEGNLLTKEQFRKAMVRAVGKALGVSTELNSSGNISRESINHVNYLYKPGVHKMPAK